MNRRHGHGIFERGSHVREYWLAHCEGFTVVESTSRLRVRAVVVDPTDGRASTVVAGAATSRRARVLPVDRIHAVDPFERVLYVEPRHALHATARSSFAAFMTPKRCTTSARASLPSRPAPR